MSLNNINSEQENTNSRTFSQNLTYWFIEPSGVTDLVERRRGRFLARLSLALLFLLIAGSIFSENNIFYLLIGVVFIAYIMVRSGYINISGAIIVFILSAYL